MIARALTALLPALALVLVPRTPQGTELPGETQAATTWAVDSEHSAVHFKVMNRGVSHVWGRFGTVEGELVLDEEDFTKSSLRLRVAADSLDTNSARRDAHLEGPDFFEVKEFPELSFESVTIRELGPDRYEVYGGLELRRVARPVTFTMVRTGTAELGPGIVHTGAEATFTVDRREWGMNHMLDSIGHEVTLMVNIEAVRGH